MSYNSISKTRGMLMGTAMLLIILFHTSCVYPPVLDLIKNFGDFGVNIFFLISGFSMYYAWQKKQEILYFYKKRFLRIGITFLPIAVVWCMFSYVLHEITLAEAIRKILTIQFWVDGNLLHWFVSGILVFYLLTPPWMKLQEKMPKFCLILTVLGCGIAVILPELGVSYIQCFLQRVPTYFMGLYLGKASYEKKAMGKKEKAVVICLGIAGFICFALDGFNTLRYQYKFCIYLLLTIPVTFFLAFALEKLKEGRLTAILNFFGVITLEVYLLHEKVIKILGMVLGKLPVILDERFIILNLVALALVIPAAWIYHQITDKVYRKIQ